MPPENLGRDNPKSNVYTLMLVVASLFIIVCIALAWHELTEPQKGGPYYGSPRPAAIDGDEADLEGIE